MIRGTWSTLFLWAARTLSSLISALLLAFGGEIFGRVFNLLIGYPWPPAVHINIYLVFIGLGAGTGAYLGWMNFGLNRYWTMTTLAITFTAGVVGVYLGRTYGPGVDPTYWWSPFATDKTIHLSAAICATVAATCLGLTHQIILLRRANAGHRRSAMTRSNPHSPNLQ